MNCKLSKESIIDLQLIHPSFDRAERFCPACNQRFEDHRNGCRIRRVPLTRYNTCPRIRRSLRKNAVIGIIITVTVSLIVLALGTYMNYLISIRTQNTENVIDFMYINEKKESPSKNGYTSTTPWKSSISLDTSRILTSESANNGFQSDAKIYAVLSFALLAVISVINIIRSCLCNSKLQTKPFIREDTQKQRITERTLVHVSVGTKTGNYEELDQENCSI